MIDIEKLILFKPSTSKANLKIDKNIVMNLEEYAINSEINYNMDSNHILTINLDVDLLGDKVNSIPYKGIIKTYAQNKTDYWIIINIDKSLDEVVLSARHWTTEIMLSMFIVDSKPRVMNCKDMINHFKVNSQEYLKNKQYAKDLETYSNLPLNQYKNMNSWHSNFYDTVSDMQELWGCEIRKQGFEVALVDFVGSKKPVYKIEYGKNLLSNSTEEDLSIVTGVLAKGYDKLYADNIIYSGRLSQNPNLLGQTVQLVYPIRLVEEGQEKEEGYIYYDNEAEAKKELERLASLEFSVNRVDEPKVSFDTKFLDLSLVEECKDLGKTYLNIGDTVATSIPKFNININTRIVEMTVDVLADEVTNITLSNNDISDLKPPTLNFIQHQIIKTENKFQSLIDDKVLELESNIEQTSEKILLEVKNTKEGLESSIEQTAKDIRLEVKNTKDGLESAIKQTAKDIRLEVSDADKRLQSQITQQAGLIESKVSAGEVKSIISQSPDQVKVAFNNGSNYVDLTADGLKTTHGDGSYSIMGKNGMKYHNGSTSKDYHYLTYVVGFTTTADPNSTVTVTLPAEFRGKDFGAYATLADTWQDSWNYGDSWVVQRMVAFVKSKDINNATVTIKGYRTDKNFENYSYRHKPIAGMLIVIA